MRPIFVSGWGGLGKTETVRAFLRQCKQKGRKVAFFSYEHSVRRTILDLQFSGYQYTPSRTSLTQEQQEEELYRQKLALLAGMGPDSVIVMDNFDSSSQTLFQMQREPAYRDLIELAGPHLIITTRFEPGGDPVKIGPLPEEMLLQLMRQYDTASPEDTLREIIRDVKGHTLTCYLIARCVGDAWGTLTAQKVLDALRQSRPPHPAAGSTQRQGPPLYRGHHLRALKGVVRLDRHDRCLPGCTLPHPAAASGRVGRYIVPAGRGPGRARLPCVTLRPTAGYSGMPRQIC